MSKLNIVAVPSRTKLFLMDKLEKLNIEYEFLPYDTFQKDEDPQPFCTLNGREFWNKQVCFFKSPLIKDQIFSLIKEIETEQGYPF